MRIYGKFAVLMVLVAMLVSGLGVLQAQDNTSGMTTCDSDLLLNLSIAERFFGFDTLNKEMMTTASDPSTVLDLSTFDRGQYGSLYTTQQSMMDPSKPDYGILSDEQYNNVVSALAKNDADFDAQYNTSTGFDASTGTALNSAAVAGEPAECTTLRTQLNRFFRAVLSEDATSGMMIGQSANTSMTDTTGTGEATAEATSSDMADVTPEATP
ncbi:MAG: hypothetical protein ABI690_35515 [Chloroflexota bacterium]